MSIATPTECDCDECADMCENWPCIPLPHEARKLIELGYESALERDDRYHLFMGEEEHRSISFLRPAMFQHKCIFLDNKRKCRIHNSGAKPFEARYVDHGETSDRFFDTMGMTVHDYVIRQWDNPKDQELAWLY